MKAYRRVALALIILVAPVYAADRFAGTWKLNIAKSTYSPGMPPKSQTTKLESVSGGLREIGDRVNADGTMTHWDWTAKYDGKDYEVKGDPDRDHVSVKRLDDYTVDVTNKKDGKATLLNHIAVSRDGKTRTNTVIGTNAKGQQVHNVLFFDRQ
jgi:hypothetical protein